MKKKLNLLLKYVMLHHASDVHFTLCDHKLKVRIRGLHEIIKIEDKKLNEGLFHYLKFIANLDLGNALLPQSGNFTYKYKQQCLYFRFSYLYTFQRQAGVLRILNNHEKIKLDDLSFDQEQNKIFESWTKFRSGLVLISGPTGSGKSTTLHAMLERIAANSKLHVISLEDPVEIQSDHYLQLQINEKMKFDYQEGIKQLLRHDPDVIMIGEVRDEMTAKMLIRCALSGHMVFTTIHAKSCQEAIKRLAEFGIPLLDLDTTLTGITNQRIFKRKGVDKRVCIYEIMEQEDIKAVLKQSKSVQSYEDITGKIRKAVEANWIESNDAESDIGLSSW